MSHKKQHTVPRSYLAAWCDPHTRPRQEPFVWLHPLDGSKPRAKAPTNILTETDFYTITSSEGERDLTLEQRLCDLEDAFARLRRSVLQERQPLTEEDSLTVRLFAAAMYARTTKQRDMMAAPFRQLMEAQQEIKTWWHNASEEERAIFRKQNEWRTQPARGDSYSAAQLEQLAERPMQVGLPAMIAAIFPSIADMHITILETTTATGFITSDNPCCLYDPHHPFPSAVSEPVIASATIEMTLPLSPKQLLLLSRASEPSELYQNIDDNLSRLGQLNQRTKRCAHKYIIANQRLEKI